MSTKKEEWGDLQVFLGKLGGIGEFLSNVDPGEFCDSRQLFFDLGMLRRALECRAKLIIMCQKIMSTHNHGLGTMARKQKGQNHMTLPLLFDN
jgi:hypothetical protein